MMFDAGITTRSKLETHLRKAEWLPFEFNGKKAFITNDICGYYPQLQLDKLHRLFPDRKVSIAMNANNSMCCLVDLPFIFGDVANVAVMIVDKATNTCENIFAGYPFGYVPVTSLLYTELSIDYVKRLGLKNVNIGRHLC